MVPSIDTTSTTSCESSAIRPLTPPQETNREATAPLESLPGRSHPSSSLQTPPPNVHEPASGATNSNVNSRRKRVEWSAHTEYKEPAEFRKIARFIKSSPLSAHSPKPIKGILKPSPSPYHSLSASFGSDVDGLINRLHIIDMLDSTIKQLAGSDRDSKLDAYMMLSRALKASNNLPDRVALQDKMSLFMQFIERDVAARSDNETLDASLINHSLTLLITFLHFPAIASTLTSDFGIFILEYSIRAFEDASTPKDIMRHLMQVVAFQNFPPKVMTSDRVGRLIKALHQIDDHATGKSIVMSRIHIYKRLIKQCKSHMAMFLDWLEDMFLDMLSTMRDIRTQAIRLATEAGFAMRHEKLLMRRANEILQSGDENAGSIQSCIGRLQKMLRERQTSSAVPQIWSAMILYMRCPLERWQHYGPWMTLIQSSFNIADSLTKQEANHAWNRYVYLSLHDSRMSPKALSKLCDPLTSQLRKKRNPKHPEESAKFRGTVIGGICSLYYYLLAPGNTKYSQDVIWDCTIRPVMAQFISLDGEPEMPGDCLMQAARMLTGLLDVTTPRAWKGDRIQEMPPVQIDELPPLECKWIRRNSDKIMQAAGPLFEKRILDFANEESTIFRLWQALVGSVAAASAKDIKVSDDTAGFLSNTLGLLSTVWARGKARNDGALDPSFLPSIRNLMAVFIDGLGLLPFTEKKLSLSSPNIDQLLTIPDSADRSDTSTVVTRTALHHLFVLLCSLPAGGTDDDALADFILSIFGPFFHGKTVEGRIGLAQELLHLLPSDSPSPSGPWILAAQNLSLLLQSNDHASTSNATDTTSLLGTKFRDIVVHLERGLTTHPNLDIDQWFSLFERLSERIVQQFGDAGRSIVVVEPLAKILLDAHNIKTQMMSSISRRAVQRLFEIAEFPRELSHLDMVRQRLWGTPRTKGTIADAFDYLYKLANHTLELFYEQYADFNDVDTEMLPIIEAIQGFVLRCFQPSGIKMLSKLQRGLCLWIQDKERLLQSREDSLLSRSIPLAWDLICGRLASHGPLDRKDLDLIELLLAAAFQSTHGGIVDRTVATWNVLVRDEQNVDCSYSLKSVISSLGSKSSLVSGPLNAGEEFGAQAPQQVEPLEDTSFIAMSSISSHQEVQLRPSSGTSDPVHAPRPMTRKRSLESKPDEAVRKVAKRSATPQTRYDNSQLHFTPIESSPMLSDGSHHLFDSQKEVRERLRETAALYSDQQDTSPICLIQSSGQRSRELANEEASSTGERTPRQSNSYEQDISSTPTPKRGQHLQVDDLDPPSSPPAPRPYPLLSEIRSRSRNMNAVESWRFSSPPVTPSTSHRQASGIPEASAMPLIETPTSVRGRKRTRNRGSRSSKKGSRDVAIPQTNYKERGGPDSVVTGVNETAKTMAAAKAEAEAANSNLSISVAEEISRTPQANHSEPRVEGGESPKSVEDEFVDARSSPDVPILPSKSPESAESPDDDNDSVDTSFALSDLDDSCMLKLIVELQAQDYNLERHQSEESPSKKPQEKPNDEVRGREDPSLPKQLRRGSEQIVERSVSPALPALPAVVEEAAEKPARKRRGRKRKVSEPVNSSHLAKKQRNQGTVEATATPIQTQQPSDTSERSLRSGRKLMGVGSVETRGSARRCRLQKREEGQTPRKEGKGRKEKEAGGDTDDEVMSQLETETRASSQNQDASQNEQKTIDGDVNPATAARTEREKSDGKESKGTPKSLMDMLQNGLDRLRNASLSREEVYKMEDMLMDMKRELFAAEKRGREGRGG